jgi:hypothetical protein
MKKSAETVALIISNGLILLVCFLIYNGFKDSEAFFGELAGIFNVIVLFPVFNLLAVGVFAGMKLKIARNVHLVISGVAILGILLFIFWSKGG